MSMTQCKLTALPCYLLCPLHWVEVIRLQLEGHPGACQTPSVRHLYVVHTGLYWGDDRSVEAAPAGLGKHHHQHVVLLCSAYASR